MFEVITGPEQWEKDLSLGGILVAQLYSSNFGPVTCVGPDIEIMMKKFKRKAEIDIRWRSVDVATLENTKRHQRLDNAREGDENGANSTDLMECDRLEKLECWSQFNHPQPFIVFFYNGILVDILRTVDAPKIRQIISELLTVEEEPKPFEGDQEIVIGHESIWDPEKERLEMEKARNEALSAALSPLFQRFFCLYEAETKIGNRKKVEECCRLLCAEDKDVETMVVNILDTPTMELAQKALVIALNEIYPEDSLEKLDALREHVATIDPKALRKERLEYLVQMLRINTRGASKMTAEHAKLLQLRTESKLPEDVHDLELQAAAQKFLPHLELTEIWNAIKVGLFHLFQTEEVIAIFLSILGEECNPNEALGEEKAKELLTNILGEEFDLESLGNVSDQSPIQLAQQLCDSDVITREHLIKFSNIQPNTSSIREMIDIDLLAKQFEQDPSEKGTVVEKDNFKMGDTIGMGIYLALLSSDINGITIADYPDALLDVLKRFGAKFTKAELATPPTAEFIEILPSMPISNLKIICCGEEWIPFFSANLGESLKGFTVNSDFDFEPSADLQKAYVNFVQQHDICDFTTNFDTEHADSFFDKESFRNLRLEGSNCINIFLKKKTLQIKSELCLKSTSDPLFSEESFTELLKLLEAKEEMIPHIHLYGACKIEEASWGKFFALLKEKQGCEHLCLNHTNISDEAIEGLANLLNENKHIGTIELKGAEPAQAQELLSKLNTDRTFDLIFQFGDNTLKNEEFQELAKKLMSENEWLVVENLE